MILNRIISNFSQVLAMTCSSSMRLETGQRGYRVIHFKKMADNTYEWVEVGNYSNGHLYLNKSREMTPHFPCVTKLFQSKVGQTLNASLETEVLKWLLWISIGGTALLSNWNITPNTLTNGINISPTEVQFRQNESMPSSVCTEDCRQGQAKKMVEGETCCWHCTNCNRFQVRILLSCIVLENCIIRIISVKLLVTGSDLTLYTKIFLIICNY